MEKVLLRNIGVPGSHTLATYQSRGGYAAWRKVVETMKPEQLIAFAFQELAGKADKIGQLNISPDLLRELLNPPPAKK